MKKDNLKTDEKPKWILLHEAKSDKLDKLYDLYKEDKEKARIYYFLNKVSDSFNTVRTVIFEYPNGDFRITKINKTFGVSSSGRMYSSEKTLEAISYSSKTGFYHYDNSHGRGGYTKQLNYLSLHNFSLHLNNNSFDDLLSGTEKPNPIIEYMTKRFGWLRYIGETNFWGITFNVIKRKKLYNLKAMLRHVYGCPYPQAKIIHAYVVNSRGNYMKVWKEQRKYLKNIESLNEKLFNHPLFNDTCRMAQMVGEMVNCSWSDKRLKTEHDKWGKAITKVLLETEEYRDLKVSSVFREFASHSGFELLTSNHALLEEGIRMNHCVGTYSQKVDSGDCGIYRVFDCTLEMVKYKDIEGHTKLRIGQYMNIGNTSPKKESYDYVAETVKSFNSTYNTVIFEGTVDDEELPF